MKEAATKNRLFLMIISLFFGAIGYAQPISLQAGRMKSSKRDGKTIQLLKDNVRFEQSGSTVYCDEAEYDPSTEDLVGRGNVRIINSEGTVVTGRNLFYNNATHIARVDGNVKLKDGSLELTTPWIQYHTQTKLGWYNAGGTIIDKETKLVSRSGSYQPGLKTLYFRYQVVLSTPDYTVKTDTLQYRTDTKVASFYSATQIDYKNSALTFQRGWYNTEKEVGKFYQQVGLFEPGKILICDTLEFDKKAETGLAHSHVYVIDSANDLKGWGQHCAYNGKTKFMSLWGAFSGNSGKALVWQTDADNNPMKIIADSLQYFNDSNAKIAFKAINGVSLKQKGFAATCKDLTSWRSDSCIRFSYHPVLWDSLTRISGDSMELQLQNKKVRNLRVFNHAFTAMQENIAYYSQIAGDSMVNDFGDAQKIKEVRVYRNAKSIYYIKNDSNLIESANTVSGKNMKISMVDGKVETVKIYHEPKGIVYPIDALPVNEAKLPGFLWDPENMPTASQFVITDNYSIPILPYSTKDGKNKKKGGRK